MRLRSCLISLLVGGSFIAGAAETSVRVVREVKAPEHARPHYIANRSPLEPSPFIKLPIGAMAPKGWLLYQLQLQRSGMVGKLKEISPWLDFEKSSWADPAGAGRFGWEEMPYWLKGYGDLGYILRDEAIIAETKKWISAAVASQRDDGWFGPRELLTSLQGKPDLWPHMVLLDILKSYHEFTGDRRVIEVMTRYMKWEHQLPPSAFGQGYWPKIRAGDNIESAYWLYNRTGEPWLLELAERIHRHMARWDEGVINWHNVNIAQGFREPGVYFALSHRPEDLAAAERNYRTVMGRYGQFPGGGFAGDENCRDGYDDPHQGFETCGIVEFMHSFEMLTKISGRPIWSDRCEEIAFNSFPASATPDWKGLHYLTCANQVQLDRNNHAPGIENGGTMFSYSPFAVYRCCQHNVSHGWPYYAEELWLATHDRGLCASLYAPSEVSAQVGDGVTVKILEETDYPFRETVTFRLSMEKPVTFPLYLRVPGWCQKAAVRVNNRPLRGKSDAQSYLVVERGWNDGDVVKLELPFPLTVRRWQKNHHAASIDYGPLTFSLRIGENWKRYGTNAHWPEWEVMPMTPWNYGLILDDDNPTKSISIVRRDGLLPNTPFVPENSPIELRAKARRIPAWKLDRLGLVGELQDSPVRTGEPIEFVSLIPMGAARLRITSFPVVGVGRTVHEWTEPKTAPVIASHCFARDTTEAVMDGREPKSSSDGGIPRFTWWDHRGTSEWIEWGFPRKQKVSGTSVYWFDDGPSGGCRVPKSWRVLYRVGERWHPVTDASAAGTALNAYNRQTFTPVEAEGLKLEVQLQEGVSAGILEWKTE